MRADPGRRRALLLWGGASLLAAVAVAVVYLAVTEHLPPDTAGVTDASRSPAPTGATAGPATGTSPSPTQQPTPRPSAADWLRDPDHPASLFMERMADPDASYHLDAETTVTSGNTTLAITTAIEVSGYDFDLTMTFDEDSRARRVRMIFKNDVYYVRADRQPWIRTTADELELDAQSLVPLLPAEAYDKLEYLGLESAGGDVHRLQCPSSTRRPSRRTSAGWAARLTGTRWTSWFGRTARHSRRSSAMSVAPASACSRSAGAPTTPSVSSAGRSRSGCRLASATTDRLARGVSYQ